MLVVSSYIVGCEHKTECICKDEQDAWMFVARHFKNAEYQQLDGSENFGTLARYVLGRTVIIIEDVTTYDPEKDPKIDCSGRNFK